jgi:hypothetical protein
MIKNNHHLELLIRLFSGKIERKILVVFIDRLYHKSTYRSNFRFFC